MFLAADLHIDFLKEVGSQLNECNFYVFGNARDARRSIVPQRCHGLSLCHLFYDMSISISGKLVLMTVHVLLPDVAQSVHMLKNVVLL